MTDTIIGGGVSEFVANRQYAKIQYLQEENKQLLEQLKDMEKALILNKEVLRLSLEQNLNNSNNSTNCSEQNQTLHLQMKLHEENEMLRNQIVKLTEERNLAQNKVLLQSQISEENQAFLKDLIVELEEKVGEMRRCIQDKEYTIQDIEKSRGLIDNGQMVKIREIVTPHEQTLRLTEELESTRQLLNKVSQGSQKLQEQNRMLKDQNQNFLREQIKYHLILRSPLAYYKMKSYVYNDDLGHSVDNLEIHNENYSNQVFNTGQNDPAPQRDGQYQQQQQNNMKYLTNNERAIYQEKLQKTESLLKGYKELFEKEKNKVGLLVQIKDDQERKIEECYSYNEVILQALKNKDQKIEQLQTEMQYYKTQFGNYMYFLKNKRKVNLDLSLQLKEPINNVQPSPPPISNNKILINFDEEFEQPEKHISVLDPVDDDPSPDNRKNIDLDGQMKQQNKMSNIQEPNYSEMNQQECKQFLQNTAIELFVQYNLKMNNLKKKQLMHPSMSLKTKPIWHAKSFSDPLDYFTLQYYNLQVSGQYEINQRCNLPNFQTMKQGKGLEKPKQVWDIDFNELSIIQGEKSQFFQ
ncbi:unnamed protein product (macronuclear) [Paramecium tetraurelia]|uniref:Uncharacterized protein n=1 Tax=Paramecium tetraurelia TaxID=5888 RepID=A0DJD0_PARTE|nr:uncharacterized protein GSPATT00017491001 [Paramecium tetraurelia]CAK83147.1 unnamed protein product [Paramecium tetraurelia]|eukprot:XP_001450544.1 hypothetical protein (macronuclear) [Paramecium tetraurelia strain d4-2]